MIPAFILLSLLLGIFSYSQIDLNLTLLQAPWFLDFQKAAIALGYYQRETATAIFLLLITGLYLVYILRLRRSGEAAITPAEIGVFIITVTIVGLLCYPGFSYDFFNYLFDARILTFYHQNPYLFKPLDFPMDNWLRFMHWVHRTYPYGPFWLALTAPFSLVGIGKFLPTVLAFKSLFLGGFFLNCFLIRRIGRKISSEKTTDTGLIFYALNPLVLLESVISPHLDSLMLTFLLLAILLSLEGKKFFAGTCLLLSAGVKFLTLILLPLFVKPGENKHRWVGLMALLFGISLIPVIWQRELYPWYFLPLFGLLALTPRHRFVLSAAIAGSLGLVLQYAPFLWVGSYPPAVQQAKLLLAVLPLGIGGLLYVGKKVSGN